MNFAPAILAALLATVLPAASAGDTAALRQVRGQLASGAKPVRIVSFGDSVTGIYYHSGGHRSYPGLLAEGLRRRHPESTVEVINAGISGNTTSNGLARLEKDVLAHRPDLVTVMFGLNDVAKGTLPLYRENLAEIVSRCRAAGAEVVLCTPNPVSATPERPVAEVAAFAEAARELARGMEVPLADVHAELSRIRREDPEDWRLSMSDEIHPNLRGHRRLAESILRVIEGAEIARDDALPVTDPLRFTREKLRKGLPVRVLAMPPADGIVAEALRQSNPDAPVEVISWPVAGLDRAALMRDAAQRVRPLAPDLVVVAIPRAAAAANEEEFIRTQMWIASNSLNRGKRAWDVVVVHPSVWGGPDGAEETRKDDLIRTIVPAQDLALIDRADGEDARPEAILRDGFAAALKP